MLHPRRAPCADGRQHPRAAGDRRVRDLRRPALRRRDAAPSRTASPASIRPAGAGRPTSRCADQDGRTRPRRRPARAAGGRDVHVHDVPERLPDDDRSRSAARSTTSGTTCPVLAVSVDPANDTPARARSVPRQAADDRAHALPARERARSCSGSGARSASSRRAPAAASTPPRSSCSTTRGVARVSFPVDQLTPEGLDARPARARARGRSVLIRAVGAAAPRARRARARRAARSTTAPPPISTTGREVEQRVVPVARVGERQRHCDAADRSQSPDR